MNRVASRLLAKAIAYKNCGKHDMANAYGKALAFFLAQYDIETDFRKSGDNKVECLIANGYEPAEAELEADKRRVASYQSASR